MSPGDNPTKKPLSKLTQSLYVVPFQSNGMKWSQLWNGLAYQTEKVLYDRNHVFVFQVFFQWIKELQVGLHNWNSHNFLQTSYKILTKFLQSSYKVLTKFLRDSNKVLTNFLWISYKLLTSFSQTSYEFLTYSNVLLMNFLQILMCL